VGFVAFLGIGFWKGFAMSKRDAYRYGLDFKVRDYECDMQGVVNNAVYQNYLEHTRHEFLLSEGIDFAELTRQHIDLVVTRAELDFKQSLRTGDSFWVGLNVELVSKVRFAFTQDVYRANDDTLMLKGRIIGTALNEKRRPMLPDFLTGLV
jgi:acyl-CoA thioester hydrolase